MKGGKMTGIAWPRSAATPAPAASSNAGGNAGGNAGAYQLLYKYLSDRFANRVVLTFAEIEDLLGFSLPGPARLQREWWGDGASIAGRSAQSDSWTLACRTATVNMAAQSVVFERQIATEPPRRH
jgi:hypothetical protein